MWNDAYDEDWNDDNELDDLEQYERDCLRKEAQILVTYLSTLVHTRTRVDKCPTIRGNR